MEWSCLDVGQFLEIGSPLGCNQGAHFLHFVFLSRTITTVVKFRRDSTGSMLIVTVTVTYCIFRLRCLSFCHGRSPNPPRLSLPATEWDSSGLSMNMYRYP